MKSLCRAEGHWPRQSSRYDYLDSFFVCLSVTTRCNQNCYYCDTCDNTKEDHPLEHFEQIVHNVYEHIDKDKYLMYIYGGEPTLYAHLKDLVGYIRATAHTETVIEVQTNGTADMELYESMKHLDVRFRLSYQQHQVDHSSFVKKADRLHSMNLLAGIDFLLERNIPATIEAIKEFFTKPYKDGIVLNPIDSSYNKVKEYDSFVKNSSDDQMQLVFTDGSKEIVSKHKFVEDYGLSFKFWNCYAGKNGLIISCNGDIYYCLSHKHYMTVPVCNILNTGDVEKFKRAAANPIKCLWDRCICELWFRKERG